MDIRISLQTIVNRALAEARQQTDALAQLQIQAATGNRLQAPSDNPALASILQAGNAQTNRLQSYLDNIKVLQPTLNQCVATLQDVTSLFSQAKQIALEGAQSTTDAQADETLATEVDRLLSKLIDNANTQSNGDYIFSGSAITTKPFSVANDSNGRPIQVTYQGAQGDTQTTVSQSETVTPHLSGAAVFQNIDRQPAVYSGGTGAAAGTGVDSATGLQTLIVRHDATTFAGGSGVQAGTGSATGDTIIGPAGAFQLTINDTSGTGAAGTVSLDGGSAIAFTNADTNLQVTGPHGEVVFLDTTNITAGLNGTVAVAASGSMSVDGGSTFTPINFSANQQLSDSRTGLVTNVNSTNIRSVGTDTIDHPGTYDAFQTLITLRDTLRNTALSSHDKEAALSSFVAEIDRLGGSIDQAIGQQSATLQSLGQLQNHVQDMKLAALQIVSNLGSADLSQVVVQMQAQQNALQLSLYGFSRILQQSLLDFLR